MATPLRLAFAGQPAYFRHCSLTTPTDGVQPAFFPWHPDDRPEDLARALAAFAPDVLVAWRPELFPRAALEATNAVTLGFLTEPLPRPGEPSHPDLDARLAHLQRADPTSFDRFVAFNERIAPAAEAALGRPVWRALPIPVGDGAFLPVRPAGPDGPRALFVGRSTAHRESFLAPVKHDFDVVHLAHGIGEDRLVGFLAEADVGLNLHNEDYPQYENRVGALLAAGLLVVTEPLSPACGLRPGIDHLELSAPWELWELLRQLRRTPDAFLRVRLAGRRGAERFRASRVWPRLAREALADVALFGPGREASAALSPGR